MGGAGRRRTNWLAAGLLVWGAVVAAWADGGPSAWPEFRGPSQQGYAGGAKLPVTWSESSNIVWKTPIEHAGWSTPVVLDGQVWCTGATSDGKKMYVYCLDAATGAILFDKLLFENADPEPLGNAVNGYASCTPAIEPGRVYVHFGSYGTAAIDTKTFEVLWTRRDLPCRHYRGPGSSVILVDDKLVLTMDGVDVQYLVALDKATGRTVWKTERSTIWNDYDANGNVIAEGDFRKGYGTPLVMEVGGRRQLISAGAMSAFSYDPATGEELWKLVYNGYNAASRPVRVGDLVVINTSHPRASLMAVRPDGRGDITATHVVWTYNRGVPIKPSPVVVGTRIYFVNDQGVATCLDGQTGEEIWKERIGGSYSASPVATDEYIYFFSETGESVVIPADGTFRIVAQNKLDDGFMSSPAVVGDALFVRTRRHVYRIGK